jgi:hypothetical protein
VVSLIFTPFKMSVAHIIQVYLLIFFIIMCLMQLLPIMDIATEEEGALGHVATVLDTCSHQACMHRAELLNCLIMTFKEQLRFMFT